jgi:predicted nuclease of predicted toxin-antitoxin system
MIIADENIDFRIVKALREQNFKAASILEDSPAIDDKTVVKIAKENEFILLTEDKIRQRNI